jgi:hypothetical protein
MAFGDLAHSGLDVLFKLLIGDGQVGTVKVLDECDNAHQGGNVVASLASQLILIPEAQDVLHITDEVVGVGAENGIDEKRYECVGGLVALVVLEEAKDDFASVEDTDDLVARSTV